MRVALRCGAVSKLVGSLVVLLVLLAAPSVRGQTNVNTLMFHGDAQRTGWRSTETVLTPANVSRLVPIWNSPQFDLVNGQTPHLYASPLYVDSVTLSTGTLTGKSFSVVFAATSNGFVYAVNAFTTSNAPAGTILWKTQLGAPSVPSNLDGGVQVGVLSTPVIDLSANPPRLYVASADSVSMSWQVFAINITNGSVLSGWPLNISDSTVVGVMTNGPATMQPLLRNSQRGALALGGSPSGSILYVPFGAYSDQGAGFMVAVDTVTPKLASAFAGAPDGRPSLHNFANGGMWASGGPALDTSGNVFITTGNGDFPSSTSSCAPNCGSFDTTPGYWGQSVLEWGPQQALSLQGTYTPWNHCQLELADIDLAGGAPIVVPDLGAANTSTPHTLAFGGKQGNVYLLDRDHMPGTLVARQACSSDASTDLSLLPPGNQPQFNTRGPLSVFGPYSETNGNLDFAKSRATPAYFQKSDGTNYLFVAGSSKQNATSQTSVPPGLARLRIVTTAGQPAYLAVDQTENTLVFNTPGSPILTSNGSSNPILWILVANVKRTDSLIGSTVPHPTLYALDPLTMQVLWQSSSSQLNVGGKYNTPAIARGVAFVGTDRIQAFGLPASSTIQINSGGPSVSPFVADVDSSGGTTINHPNTIDLTGVTNPAPTAVYQTARVGTFSYTIGGFAPSSSHTVRLHFAETYWSATGKRTFNVTINGAQVLSTFDIFKTATGKNKAVIEQFAENADASGRYVIQFTAILDKSLISGIEIQ
jgi:hypothetical protein